jgi:LPS-assembly lipoprotein
MWWCEHRFDRLRLVRLALALAVASLTGGCFEPLYGSHPSVDSDNIHDKLASVDIPAVSAARGTPAARIASEMHNTLLFDFNGGSLPAAPVYRLDVSVGTGALSVIVDLTSGRPDAQLDIVTASYSLVELSTGKVVLHDSTAAHVDYDIPGSAQRFAAARAQREAEDRATTVVAETIRNRLASYFVAGT